MIQIRIQATRNLDIVVSLLSVSYGRWEYANHTMGCDQTKKRFAKDGSKNLRIIFLCIK